MSNAALCPVQQSDYYFNPALSLLLYSTLADEQMLLYHLA